MNSGRQLLRSLDVAATSANGVLVLVLGEPPVGRRQPVPGEGVARDRSAAVDLPEEQAEADDVGQPHLHAGQQQRHPVRLRTR